MSGEEDPVIPAPGAKLGPYTLVRPVGEGAMGVVWLAREEDLGRQVAVKILRASLAADHEAIERFDTEARAAARLQHHGIVTVYGVGRTGGLAWIAMEYVHGVNLAAVLAETRLPPGAGASASDLGNAIRAARLRARLDPGVTGSNTEGAAARATGRDDGLALVLSWIRSAAEGVAHAHARGVLHRDLKPSNLLLDGEGRVRVADFGVARIDDAVTLTRTGAVVGTLGYMAPEVLHGSPGGVDVRADVYSLGVVLYQLTSRRLPYEEATIGALLRSVDEGTVPRLSRHLRGCPADLEAVVARCLAREREDRYATAGDLAEDLLRWERGEAVHARPLGVQRRARAWLRAHPRTAWFAITVAVAGMATAAVERSARSRRRAEAIRSVRSAVADALTTAAERQESHENLLVEHAAIVADIAMSVIGRSDGTPTFESSREAAIASLVRRRNEVEIQAASAMESAGALLEEAERIEREAFGAPTPTTRRERVRHELMRADLAERSDDWLRAELSMRRIREIDPGGEILRELDVRATLRVGQVPAGVQLHLFAYEDLSALQGAARVPRLVPVPCGSDGTVEPGPWWRNWGAGSLSVEVAGVLHGSPADAAGIRQGDYIVDLWGTESADGVRVRAVHPGGRAAIAGVKPWMRLSRVGNRRLTGMQDWNEIRAIPCTTPMRIEFSVAASMMVSPGSTPEEYLGIEVASSEQVLADAPPPGGASLVVHGAEGPRTVHLEGGAPTGLQVRSTIYPLARLARNRIEPGSAVSLPAGRYCLLASGGSRESARQPLLLRRGEETSITWDLVPAGSTPEGFLRIHSGPYLPPLSTEDSPTRLERAAGTRLRVEVPSFVIGRTEVTTSEWYSFLNDSSIALRRSEDAAFARRVLPRTADEMTPLWRLAEDGAVVGIDPETAPVRGVSRTGIGEFLSWKNARLSEDGAPWRWRLPTPEQWRRAACGGDGRPYPWGWEFVYGFAIGWDDRGGSTHPAALPGGSAPGDESPFGILDLAGSRREWAIENLILGGSWGDSGWRVSHSGFAEQWSPDTAHGTLGFRVVLEPAR